MSKQMINARQWNTLVNGVVKLEQLLRVTSWVCASYQTTKKALAEARETLRQALERAEWGPNGCSFVTRRAQAIGSIDIRTDLYLNRRHRATLWASGRVDVHSAEDAEVKFQKEKKECREDDQKYKKDLEVVARLLWEQNITNLDIHSHWDNPNYGREIVLGWTYWTGQDGGYFQNEDGLTVSARGALKRAGKIEAEEGPCLSGPEWQMCDEALEAERKYHGARY